MVFRERKTAGTVAYQKERDMLRCRNDPTPQLKAGGAAGSAEALNLLRGKTERMAKVGKPERGRE